MSRPTLERSISALAVAICVYMFYAAFFGPYKTTIVHRAIFLAAMLIPFFWSICPLGKTRLAFLVDSLLVVASVISLGYVVFFWEAILSAIGGRFLTTSQLAVGCVIILVILEGVRRISLGLLVIVIAAICYTMFGNYLPGDFSHAGMGFKRFIYLSAFSHEGIFGLGLAVASTFLFIFVLFSTALQETGAADFFLKFTNTLVGQMRGAPAKCAVVASGLTGTVSGSSIANVVTTGSVTIPLMIKMGFKPHKAAAVEVVASEGGQLMPPVMGAGAFLMAELTGIPYWSIALAALFPALLYYLSAFVVVDTEAAKMGLKGVKRVAMRGEKVAVFLGGWHYLVALLLLFYLLLVSRLTASVSGIITMFMLIFINQMRPGNRIGVRQILGVFDKGARGAAEITVLIASVGLIQQAFTVTGLAHTLSDLLVALAGDSAILMLIMAMIIAIILGMGMPTPIAYLLSGVFVAPAVIAVGFSPMAAHLFLFFFAIKSGSTPPVAVVAVVAAGIAKASWWKTAWVSLVYSFPGFCIAYAFMYHPEYLLEGTWLNIVIYCIFGVIGTAGVAYALQRYMFTKMNIGMSVLLGIASFVMVVTPLLPTLMALVFVLLVVFLQRRKALRESKTSVETSQEISILSNDG